MDIDKAFSILKRTAKEEGIIAKNKCYRVVIDTCDPVEKDGKVIEHNTSCAAVMIGNKCQVADFSDLYTTPMKKGFKVLRSTTKELYNITKNK